MTRQQVLTPNVLIPLGSAIAVLTAIGGIAWQLHVATVADVLWKERSEARDKTQLAEIERLRTDLTGRIIGRGPAAWNRSDMEGFRHDLQANNRELDVPILRPYIPN